MIFKPHQTNLDSAELEKAYEYCRRITKTHAKSFYFAAKFLPKRKQNPIYALYALCRHVDDEVDESGIANEAQAAAAVENWKARLDEVYSGQSENRSEPPAIAGGLKPKENSPRRRRDAEKNEAESEISDFKFQSENQNFKFQAKDRKVDFAPETEDRFSTNNEQRTTDKGQNLVLSAWRDLLKTCKIPQNLPLELMKGVLMDTHVKRYETFDELYVYCFRVASTVGLMSSEIFGYREKKALEYAEALGIAMQLTNILRDVGEDAAMNRIYLPAEDLRKFGVSEKQIFDNHGDENFANLMKFQIRRARGFYKKSEKGIALLEKDARFAVLLAARFYAKILDEIERQNYDVFKRRAHTSFTQKIFSLPRIWRESRESAANESEP